MKKLTIIILSLFVAFTAYAQEVEGELEIKTGRKAGSYGDKKLKKAPKKIFINQFRVFHQVVYFDSDYARAGYDIGGGDRAAAKASLSVALNGVDQNQLIENTTRLYREYVGKLQAAGFEVLSIEQVASAEYFEDHERISGGKVNTVQEAGYLMVTPKGFDYYVRKVKDGKEKKSLIDKRYKLSYELESTIIADVDLYLPFMEESQSTGSKLAKRAVGGVAKVVASPYYRLDASKSKTSYVYGKNKFGAEAVSYMPMDEDLKITGVFDEDQKFKSAAKAENDQTYQTGAWTFVVPAEDVEESNVQFIDCDANQYINGAYKAATMYMEAQTAQFLEFANK